MQVRVLAPSGADLFGVAAGASPLVPLTIMITGVQRFDVELLAGACCRAVLHLTTTRSE